MEDDDTSLSLDTLPVDVLAHIAKDLSFQDLENLSCVSSPLHAFFGEHHEQFWRLRYLAVAPRTGRPIEGREVYRRQLGVMRRGPYACLTCLLSLLVRKLSIWVNFLLHAAWMFVVYGVVCRLFGVEYNTFWAGVLGIFPLLGGMGLQSYSRHSPGPFLPLFWSNLCRNVWVDTFYVCVGTAIWCYRHEWYGWDIVVALVNGILWELNIRFGILVAKSYLLPTFLFRRAAWACVSAYFMAPFLLCVLVWRLFRAIFSNRFTASTRSIRAFVYVAAHVVLRYAIVYYYLAVFYARILLQTTCEFVSNSTTLHGWCPSTGTTLDGSSMANHAVTATSAAASATTITSMTYLDAVYFTILYTEVIMLVLSGPLLVILRWGVREAFFRCIQIMYPSDFIAAKYCEHHVATVAAEPVPSWKHLVYQHVALQRRWTRGSLSCSILRVGSGVSTLDPEQPLRYTWLYFDIRRQLLIGVEEPQWAQRADRVGLLVVADLVLGHVAHVPGGACKRFYGMDPARLEHVHVESESVDKLRLWVPQGHCAFQCVLLTFAMSWRTAARRKPGFSGMHCAVLDAHWSLVAGPKAGAAYASRPRAMGGAAGLPEGPPQPSGLGDADDDALQALEYVPAGFVSMEPCASTVGHALLAVGDARGRVLVYTKAEPHHVVAVLHCGHVLRPHERADDDMRARFRLRPDEPHRIVCMAFMGNHTLFVVTLNQTMFEWRLDAAEGPRCLAAWNTGPRKRRRVPMSSDLHYTLQAHAGGLFYSYNGSPEVVVYSRWAPNDVALPLTRQGDPLFWHRPYSDPDAQPLVLRHRFQTPSMLKKPLVNFWTVDGERILTLHHGGYLALWNWRAPDRDHRAALMWVKGLANVCPTGLRSPSAHLGIIYADECKVLVSHGSSHGNLAVIDFYVEDHQRKQGHGTTVYDADTAMVEANTEHVGGPQRRRQ